MIKKIKHAFNNLSLNKKIFILLVFGAVLPLGLAFALSLSELSHATQERQIYAMNQGYNQVYQSLDERLSRVHNISTLVAVNDTVNLTLKLKQNDMDLVDQLALFEKISSYTFSIELSFEANNIVFFINDKFKIVNSQNRRYRKINTVVGSNWYYMLYRNKGKPTWVPIEEKGEYQGEQYIALVRNLWNEDNYLDPLGVLAIFVDKTSVENIFIDSNKAQHLYIETSEGELLAANNKEESLVRIPVHMRSNQDSGISIIDIEGESYYARSSLIQDTNVYLVSLLPTDAINKVVDDAVIRMIIIYSFVCMVLLIIVYPITRSITYRIALLRKQMGKVEQGTLSKLVMTDEYTDEIGHLIVHYNKMVGKVDKLLGEQYTLGQEKTVAELKALQSQINPHFLYNTLDMINWMAQKGETDNISSVIQAMSMFYRLTLSKGKDIITIRDELKLCQAYMEIQKRRYRGKIRYEEEVQEEIFDCLIPKITLQPFLENAILHGINEKEDARGVIILNGWMEEGRIIISVTDDGIGMRQAEKEQSTNSNHYGMGNIEQRLSMFYKEAIPIVIESSLGIGTCIIINIPIVRT